MKKLVCVLLIIMMLLSLAACTGKDEPAPTAIPDYTAVPAQTQEAQATDAAPESTAVPFPEQSAERAKYDPDTDADNRCTTTNSALIWGEGGFYWYSVGNSYLMYYDEGLEEMMPVCSKPECEHIKDGNVWYQNKTCDAYLQANRNPSLYNGKLYYVDISDKMNPNINERGSFRIFRMEPDGTQKEYVKDVFTLGYDSPQWFIVHRGYLYAMSIDFTVVDGEPYSSSYILAVPLEGSETNFRILYERDGGSWGGVRFIGDNCYFYLRYSEGEYEEDENGEIIAEPVIGAVIGRINIEKNAMEILFDDFFPEGATLMEMWVDSAETVYAALSDGFYRLENSGFVKLFDFNDEKLSYYPHFIMDDMVIAYDTSYKGTPFMEAWIRRFDGSDIYKGPLSLDWLDELKAGAEYEGVMCVIADGNDIYCEYSVRWTTPNHQNEPKGTYLVRYTIEDGEIEWKVLGSYYDKIMK